MKRYLQNILLATLIFLTPLSTLGADVYKSSSSFYYFVTGNWARVTWYYYADVSIDNNIAALAITMTGAASPHDISPGQICSAPIVNNHFEITGCDVSGILGLSSSKTLNAQGTLLNERQLELKVMLGGESSASNIILNKE